MVDDDVRRRRHRLCPRRCGDGAQVFDLVAPYADLPVMASLAVVCFGSTHRALGIAASTFGDVELAIVHLEAAITANRRLGNRPFTAIAAADLAVALLRRDREGDRERAVELLRWAAVEAGGAGMDSFSCKWAEQAETAERHVGTLRASGGRWFFSLCGEQAVVPERVGIRHLATLLRSPGVEVPALVLAGSGQPRTPAGRDCVLDDHARAAYRKRIDELREQLDQADRLGLPKRSVEVQAEPRRARRAPRRGDGSSGPVACVPDRGRAGAHRRHQGDPANPRRDQ